jgi:hypothetical protein
VLYIDIAAEADLLVTHKAFVRAVESGSWLVGQPLVDQVSAAFDNHNLGKNSLREPLPLHTAGNAVLLAS